MSKKIFKIFDAFAGVGGIRLGFELANKNFKTIYAVDINAKCKETYDLNFEDCELTIDDISKLKINDIPDFDIITAGFPCQPYSISGKRLALEDKRGKIVYDLLNIIKNKKPKVVFLENVKNFKSINDGEVYKFVIEELEIYGYKTKDMILNTCNYTEIPQNRERIFIIGFLDHKICDKFEFPEKTNNKKKFTEFLEEFNDSYEYTEEDKIYNQLKKDVKDCNKVYQFRRHYVRENKNNNVPTLTANMGTGGHNVPLIVQLVDGEKRIRKLSPKECFNFQGFPKSYKLGKISNGELYKQAGNSVTVEIIKLLATNIYNAFTSNNNKENKENKENNNSENIFDKILNDKTLNGLENNYEDKKEKIEIYHNNIKYEILTEYKIYNKSYYKNLEYLNTFRKIFDEIKIKSGSTRKTNIDETFTEGLYCYLTGSYRIIKFKNSKITSSIDCYNPQLKKTIQIKTSTCKDDDCSSFGPTSEFDILIFIDFYDDSNYKIYEIYKKYLDNLILVKKNNETFDEQKKQKRRPHFSIKNKIIDENDIKPIFIGNINHLENDFNIINKIKDKKEDDPLPKKKNNNKK
jgi:DNA (cytosine-5)-methyltransferase 1